MKKMVIVLGIITIISLIINKKEDYILIPNEAIRVRVISNSSSDKDIKIKEELKDKLNIELNQILKNSNNINETRNLLINNLDFINSFVDKTIKDLKYDLDYSINYGMNYFPEKIFKGIKYNSGLYESLVITLGEGLGPNYWCVLYPPLCGIEDNKEEVEYRSIIYDLIDKYL